MKKLQSSTFYKFSIALEIILFSFSVVVLNVLIGNQEWIWSGVVAVVIIGLEIMLKISGMNPLLKVAKEREERNLLLEKKGVSDIFFMRDDLSKNKRNTNIYRAIKDSNELSLIAETGRSYIDISTARHWPSIKNKIDKGIKLKMLLINPLCENKTVRNTLNKEGLIDRKFDFERVKELSKHPHVSIRFTNEVYCSLFYTDSYMIYDPYHLGKIGDRIENNFVAIEFTKGNENYNILKNHFENCWDKAVDINLIEEKYEAVNTKL